MESTIVYKLGGPHRGPKGVTYSYKGVSDEITLGKLLGDGWFRTLEEVVNPPVTKDPAEEYVVGLPEEKNIKTKPDPASGALGELPKRGRGRPKKKKEIFGDEG